MIDPRHLDELAERLGRVLPPGLRALRTELEHNFRAVLQTQFDRLDLVSRERFETQAELLLRTQKRLSALEQRLAALEASAGAPPGD